MPSDQTGQHIRSVITELDGGCVDGTWRECEGWLIYGQRTNLGLIRLELCRPERLEPQARLDILDRPFRDTSQTHTARLTREQG